MSTNSIRLDRVLRTTPEKFYRAFLEPDAIAKWIPPDGFTCKVQHIDAKVGGTYKMSFTNFTTGQTHSFGGKYIELTPHKRICYTDKFDDPNMAGEITATIELKILLKNYKISFMMTSAARRLAPGSPSDSFTFRNPDLMSAIFISSL